MTTERTDRVNRAMLLIFGVVLLGLGIAVLLHSSGALSVPRRESPVVSSPTAAWYGANSGWVWPAVAALSAILLVLSVWWASAQVRLAGTSRIELERDPGGSVSVDGGYLADCIEHDAMRQQSIERARARVTTSESGVQVWLTIWVGPPYDVGHAAARVTRGVLSNLRGFLGDDDAPHIRTHVTVEAAESAMPRLS